MAEFDGLNHDQMIVKARKMCDEMAEELENNHRILALMDAGLVTRPWDKDFVEVYRQKIKHKEQLHELGKLALQAVGK